MHIIKINDIDYNTCEVHALGLFGSTIPNGGVLYTPSLDKNTGYLFIAEKSDNRELVSIMPGSAYMYCRGIYFKPCTYFVETTRQLSLCSYPTEQELYSYFKVNYGI